MHQEIIAVLIFVLVLVTIMSEKLHRTSAALGGTVLLLLTGILNVDKAIKYVDFNTIGVLVGMMLFVAVIKHSGLFEYILVFVGYFTYASDFLASSTYKMYTEQ